MDREIKNKIYSKTGFVLPDYIMEDLIRIVAEKTLEYSKLSEYDRRQIITKMLDEQD